MLLLKVQSQATRCMGCCLPTCPPAAACHRTPKLRSALARALKARNMPQLVFKHDGLTEQQQEVEDVFRRLDEEAEAERAAAAAAADAEAWGDAAGAAPRASS
jgi:hypothetical protein